MVTPKEGPGYDMSVDDHLVPDQGPDQMQHGWRAYRGSADSQSSAALEGLQAARAVLGLPSFIFLLSIGLLSHQGGTELGHQGEGHVPIPSGPASHLVLIESALAFGPLNRLLDFPALPSHLHDL